MEKAENAEEEFIEFNDCIRYKSKASDLALQILDELRKTRFENYVAN